PTVMYQFIVLILYFYLSDYPVRYSLRHRRRRAPPLLQRRKSIRNFSPGCNCGRSGPFAAAAPWPLRACRANPIPGTSARWRAGFGKRRMAARIGRHSLIRRTFPPLARSQWRPLITTPLTSVLVKLPLAVIRHTTVTFING